MARSGLRPIFLVPAWLMLAAIALVASRGRARASTWDTLVNGSFAGYSTLESAWAYRYSKSPFLPIRYHSGAIHAKEQVLVNDQCHP